MLMFVTLHLGQMIHYKEYPKKEEMDAWAKDTIEKIGNVLVLKTYDKN